MIIKSNTHRYWPGIFKRLIRYVDSDKERSPVDTFSIFHNLQSVSVPDIIAEFETNDTQRKQRKNGICLQHHIMSFAPETSPHLDATKLHDLAQHYLNLREENGLAYVKPHLSEAHIHLHFLISGNEINSAKSTRRSKEQFQSIHKALEKYQLEKYPELADSLVKIVPEQSKDWQLAELQQIVTQAFGQAQDQPDFLTRLQAQKLEPYFLNEKIRGFFDEKGQKHRFKKFGIDVNQLIADAAPKIEPSAHPPKEPTLAELQTMVSLAFGKAKDQSDFLERLKAQHLEPYLDSEKIRGFLDSTGQRHDFQQFQINVDQLIPERTEKSSEPQPESSPEPSKHLSLEELQTMVAQAFDKAKSQTDFFAQLKEHEIEPYFEDKKIDGFLDQHGQKHALEQFQVNFDALLVKPLAIKEPEPESPPEPPQGLTLDQLQAIVSLAFGQSKDQSDFLNRLQAQNVEPFFKAEKIGGFLDQAGQKYSLEQFQVNLDELVQLPDQITLRQQELHQPQKPDQGLDLLNER